LLIILKPFQLVIHAVTPLICRAVLVVSFLESTWQPFEKTHTTEKYLNLGPLGFSWVNLHFFFTYVVPQLRWEAILHFSFIFVSGVFFVLMQLRLDDLKIQSKDLRFNNKKRRKMRTCLSLSFLWFQFHCSFHVAFKDSLPVLAFSANCRALLHIQLQTECCLSYEKYDLKV